MGNFSVCRRLVNVTPILKGPPSFSVANYSPISITHILSKVFECVWCRIILDGLQYSEVSFQRRGSPIGKFLALVMPFCGVPQTLQRELK